ncbi:hypothetical protein [Paenibacillus aceti]|uniref:Transposase n=1 Tax=Paenibacillus aceti TaxID=1820010 RepID=A0ABQ1W1I1_9BACL|nr:hypothetical protein [Paenibacillus aceti]GGG10083.1 hypothetical protein GCM10010913_34840 [Paenibacillus aceti]
MPAESGSATFYNYRLLKRVTIPKALIGGLLTLPFIWLLAEIIFISWTSIFTFILALFIILWIQFVITRSVLIIISHSYKKRWHFRLRMPWIGYLPEQFVSYPNFRRTQHYTTWISCLIILALIPWSPVSFTMALFFWHFWIMAPRLIVLIRFRKQPRDGIIKLNPQDASYYMP